MSKKFPAKTNDMYAVVRDAVETGIGWGIMHGFKHSSEQISDAQILVLKEHILNDVMNELCDKLDFDVQDKWASIQKEMRQLRQHLETAVPAPTPYDEK